MNGQPARASRLLRAVVAGGILAGGWFIVDMVTSPEPVAAAASIDLLPGGETPVSDLVDTVIVDTVITDTVLVVLPQATPIIAPVTSALDPVIAPVDTAVAPLQSVTAPILNPVREATQPVVDAVVAPVLAGAVAAITPVVAPVVDGLEPIVGSLEPVTSSLVPVVDAVAVGLGADAPLAAAINSRGGILSGDSSPAVSIALLGAIAVGAASFAPGGPLNPTGRTPVTPEGVTAAGGAFLGEIVAGMPIAHATAAPASGELRHPHASPVFASDTTPD